MTKIISIDQANSQITTAVFFSKFVDDSGNVLYFAINTNTNTIDPIDSKSLPEDVLYFDFGKVEAFEDYITKNFKDFSFNKGFIDHDVYIKAWSEIKDAKEKNPTFTLMPDTSLIVGMGSKKPAASKIAPSTLASTVPAVPMTPIVEPSAATVTTENIVSTPSLVRNPFSTTTQFISPSNVAAIENSPAFTVSAATQPTASTAQGNINVGSTNPMMASQLGALPGLPLPDVHLHQRQDQPQAQAPHVQRQQAQQPQQQQQQQQQPQQQHPQQQQVRQGQAVQGQGPPQQQQQQPPQVRQAVGGNVPANVPANVVGPPAADTAVIVRQINRPTTNLGGMVRITADGRDILDNNGNTIMTSTSTNQAAVAITTAGEPTTSMFGPVSATQSIQAPTSTMNSVAFSETFNTGDMLACAAAKVLLDVPLIHSENFVGYGTKDIRTYRELMVKHVVAASITASVFFTVMQMTMNMQDYKRIVKGKSMWSSEMLATPQVALAFSFFESHCCGTTRDTGDKMPTLKIPNSFPDICSLIFAVQAVRELGANYNAEDVFNKMIVLPWIASLALSSDLQEINKAAVKVMWDSWGTSSGKKKNFEDKKIEFDAEIYESQAQDKIPLLALDGSKFNIPAGGYNKVAMISWLNYVFAEVTNPDISIIPLIYDSL